MSPEEMRCLFEQAELLRSQIPGVIEEGDEEMAADMEETCRLIECVLCQLLGDSWMEILG